MIHSCTIHGHQCLAIDSQVCFHGRLFADRVKLSWCITGPTGPLGSTNQNLLHAKLLPMAVLIYPVVCVHSCCQLGTQHYCLCSNSSDSRDLITVEITSVITVNNYIKQTITLLLSPELSSLLVSAANNITLAS